MTILVLQILIGLILVFFLSRHTISLLSATLFRLLRHEGAVVSALAFLLLPGTFIHEVGHLLSAETMGVKTDDLNVFPSVGEDHSVILGGVRVQKTDPIRRTLIGLAPVFFGLAVIWVTSFYITQFKDSSWFWILYLYLLMEINLTMFSSSKDLEGAVAGLLLLALGTLGIKFLSEVLVIAAMVNLKDLFIHFLNNNLVYLRNGLYIASGVDLGLIIIFGVLRRLRA